MAPSAGDCAVPLPEGTPSQEDHVRFKTRSTTRYARPTDPESG
jgi:hypothetical protein